MFRMYTCIRWEFVSFQIILPLSLTSSISCASWWVLTLITDARAHFNNCEQCTCSRGLVYTLSYVGAFGTVCPSVVSCILYQSSGTSWGSLPHCRVAAFCYLIKMQLSNVPAAVHSPMWDTTGTFPIHCLLPRKYFVSRQTNTCDDVESGQVRRGGW